MRDVDRAADVGAIQVAVEARRDGGAVGDGVVGLGESVVAVELPKCAVKAVGAGFSDERYLGPGGSAVTGRRGAGLYLELRDGVDGGREAEGDGVVVHRLEAVDEVAVEKVALAIDADRGRPEAGVGLTYGAAAATHSDRCRRPGVGSGDKLGELDEVTSVEWEVDDFVGVNDSADDRIFSLGSNGNRVDLNDLANRANLQLRIDARGLAYLERN